MHGLALKNRRILLKEFADVEEEYKDKKSRNQGVREMKIQLNEIVRKLASHIRRYGESENGDSGDEFQKEVTYEEILEIVKRKADTSMFPDGFAEKVASILNRS